MKRWTIHDNSSYTHWGFIYQTIPGIRAGLQCIVCINLNNTPRRLSIISWVKKLRHTALWVKIWTQAGELHLLNHCYRLHLQSLGGSLKQQKRCLYNGGKQCVWVAHGGCLINICRMNGRITGGKYRYVAIGAGSWWRSHFTVPFTSPLMNV